MRQRRANLYSIEVVTWPPAAARKSIQLARAEVIRLQATGEDVLVAPAAAPAGANSLRAAFESYMALLHKSSGDSPHESSMIARSHEQLGPDDVQDHELVGVASH
jgi:hypothetical protein